MGNAGGASRGVFQGGFIAVFSIARTALSAWGLAGLEFVLSFLGRGKLRVAEMVMGSSCVRCIGSYPW